MSFGSQVRFYDQHDDRTRVSNSDSRDRGGGGGNRGNYNYRGGRGYNRGQNSRGGYNRGGNRGRGNQRGGGSYGRGARDAIMSKSRRRGDWRVRQQQRRSNEYDNRRSALADDEDDVSMDRGGGTDNGTVNNSFRGRYQRGRGRGNYGGTNYRNSWYRINIPFGTKISKKRLFDSLNDMLEDTPFAPVNYHTQGDNAAFFVKDVRVAEAIKGCSRRITNDNGYKVIFHSMRSNPPITKLDEAAIEKMKISMSNRYTPEVKALDLSDFHHDPELNKEGIYPAMTRQSTIEEIAKIIGEHIPEVECLLLSKNCLSDLRILKDIVTKAPNVQKLDLSENMITSETELDRIKDMKLVDMRLDKNPVSQKFRDETAYVAAIRKHFPKLMKLDGNELPAVISFAVEDKVELPTTQGSFFLTDDSKTLVLAFLEEYFRIFDSDDRQKLMDAYHENAYFSMSVFSYKSSSAMKQPHLGDYQSDSRNLKVLRESTRQQKMLQHGKLSIVAQLAQLPKTQHDASTISVDITLATPAMMSFTVSGVFKELSGKYKATRAFSRVFITVPRGPGVVILNEQLTITNPTPELSARSFKDPTPATPAPSPVMSSAVPVPAPAPAVPVPAPAPPIQSPADIQQAMIRQFSAKSGMNADWSAKCLAHNNWDFDRSAKVFTEMMAKNQIPPEAFVTTALSP